MLASGLPTEQLGTKTMKQLRVYVFATVTVLGLARSVLGSDNGLTTIGPMQLRKEGDSTVVVRGWSRYSPKDQIPGSGQCQLVVLAAFGDSIMFGPWGMLIKLGSPPNTQGFVAIIDAPGCRWTFNAPGHFERDGIEITAIQGATIEFTDDGSVVTRGLEFRIK
jgi:hypothetical protein